MNARSRSSRRTRGVQPWLAGNPSSTVLLRLVMLVGFALQLVLAGSFGETMARKIDRNWIEICSAEGMRFIQVDPAAGDFLTVDAPDAPGETGPSDSRGKNPCGDCVVGKAGFGILPQTAALHGPGLVPANAARPVDPGCGPAVTAAAPRGPPAA